MNLFRSNQFQNGKLLLFQKSGLVHALRPGMRLGMGKENRSGVYYLINTVTPINHALKAELDAFGSVIVVVLLLGVVSLVRLILGWA
jgi:hypothetical protein